MINNQFSEALTVYQDILWITQKLRDEFKIDGPKCNFGIVYMFFYCR